MLRGEFHFANGLVVPNNVTIAGAGLILASALRGDALALYIGLCSAVYAPDLRIEQVTEPTLATNGYARLAVARSIVGWPSGGLVNGENYLESLPLVWAAVGGPFDQPVTRMFICGSANATAGDVIALSAPLPFDLVVTPTTLLNDRTFKYRLHLR